MRAIPSLLVTGLFLLFPLAFGACGTTGTGGGGGSRNVVSAAQIEEAGLGSTSAYEVIERLRPNWLRSRTSTIVAGPIFPVVFIDGTRYGDLASLRSVGISDVEEMRFLAARDATTRYGTGYLGGIIEVSTRR